MQNEKWDYKIDGKIYGIARIIIVSVLALFFTVLAVDQFKPLPNKLIPLGVSFAFTAVCFLGVACYLVIRYFCFKIYIGKNGFYYQTGISKGKYYKYADIAGAGEKLVVHRHGGIRGPHQRTYHYYFVFTLKTGENHKVIFEKTLFEYEIDVLLDRINKR